jgi:2-dehydro-3-deoxyphosphogluconate aldolase/(4S)-4-hydroxy-2-oxoglutarate aldolase
MSFSSQHIISEILSSGLVPLLSHDNPEHAQKAMEAAYRGGVRTFEYTNRKKNSFEVFTHLLSVAKNLPGLMLGIGTVMDAETTTKYINSGAHFIISPILKLEMAKVCKEYGKPWIPGCATLTEIVTAKENGAEVIKLFPGSVLGPEFVSAIMPVVPDLKLMITGGVEPNERNLSAWFNSGAACIGMGSQLFSKDIMDAQDWKALELRIRNILEIIKAINPNV